MEIQKPETVLKSKEARPVAGGLQADITRQNRENILEVSETQRLDKADRVELSSTAQRLAEDREAEASARAERLEELRAAMEAGRLNDSARIERAAHQLLSDG